MMQNPQNDQNAGAVKILCLLLILSACLSARATTVTGAVYQITGNGLPARLIVSPTNLVSVGGSGLVAGPALSFSFTNGFSTNLLTGYYSVTIPPKQPFTIQVTNDSAALVENITNLIQTGALFQVATNPSFSVVAGLTPGTNITFQTNGSGITINGTGGGSGATLTNAANLPAGVISGAAIGTNIVVPSYVMTNGYDGTPFFLNAQLNLDPLTGATFGSGDGILGSDGSVTATALKGAVTNTLVSFTITTNLAYTNWLESMGASNANYNTVWIWTNNSYVKLGGSGAFAITNAGGLIALRSAGIFQFTNEVFTGLFKTNSNQSTPPYVFYPSNAVITTNWFIAGASFKMPVPAVNFEDYGGRGDAVKLYSATVNAGQLITTNASFTSDMVGRWAAIYSTSSNTAYVLTRVVQFNNSTNVTLATNYTQSTPYEAQVFSDNFTSMTNMLGSLSGSVIINYTGQYGDNYGFASSALHPTCGHSYVINIPANLSTDPRTNLSRTIVMNGRVPDLIYPQYILAGNTNTVGSPNKVGTVLLNFAKPVSGVTNAFVLADGTGQGYSQFAKECVVWQNMQLRQPGKPTHHALWRARGGTTSLINFGFSVDMSANWLNVTSGVPPFYMESIVSNANSIFCDYGPDPYNYAGSYYENVTFGYHGTSFRAEEHLVGSGKISMVGCGSGMYLDAASGNRGTFTGPVFPMLYSYLCQYPITISTNSTQREPLWVGSFNTEEGYPSVQIGPMIYDPLKRGQIVIGNITGTAQNTTIQSTNGQWHDSIKNYSYDSGVIVSNGTVTAASFTGNVNAAGLIGLTALKMTNITFYGDAQGTNWVVENAQGLTGTNSNGGSWWNLSGSTISLGLVGAPASVVLRGNGTSSKFALGNGVLNTSAFNNHVFVVHTGTDQNMVINAFSGVVRLLSINDADSAYKEMQIDGLPLKLNTASGAAVIAGGTITANSGFIFPYLQPTTNGLTSQGGIVGCNGTNYWSVQRDSGGVLTTNKFTLTTWP